MNNKGVINDFRIILAWPLLMLIDLLLKTPPVARALFNVSFIKSFSECPPVPCPSMVLYNMLSFMWLARVLCIIFVHHANLRPCSAHHAIQVSVMQCMQGLAQPETVRKVLQSVYVDESAVDDELVDIILQPAFTANALQVFVSVITGE